MDFLTVATKLISGRTTTTSSEQVHVEAQLPPELERYIFEMAAWNDIACALKLLILARRVNEWVLPILYHSMMFTDLPFRPRMKNLVTRATSTPINRPFLSRFKYTQHLILDEHGIKCLPLMPNVTHLISRQPHRCTDEYIWGLTALPLTHLYFLNGYLGPVVGYSVVNPGLRWLSLTHLLYYGTIAETLDLTHLPALTHFASSTRCLSFVTLPLARSSFRVCVYFTTRLEKPEEWKARHNEDPRIVFMPQRRVMPCIAMVGYGTWNDVESIWEEAELMVEAQSDHPLILS